MVCCGITGNICDIFCVEKYKGNNLSVIWLFIYAIFLFSIVLIDYRFNIGTSWYLSTSGFIIGWYIPDIKEKYENIFDNRVRILSFVLFLLSYTCTNTLGVRYK